MYPSGLLRPTIQLYMSTKEMLKIHYKHLAPNTYIDINLLLVTTQRCLKNLFDSNQSSFWSGYLTEMGQPSVLILLDLYVFDTINHQILYHMNFSTKALDCSGHIYLKGKAARIQLTLPFHRHSTGLCSCAFSLLYTKSLGSVIHSWLLLSLLCWLCDVFVPDWRFNFQK